jgi:hypothetical protein
MPRTCRHDLEARRHLASRTADSPSSPILFLYNNLASIPPTSFRSKIGYRYFLSSGYCGLAGNARKIEGQSDCIAASSRVA